MEQTPYLDGIYLETPDQTPVHLSRDRHKQRISLTVNDRLSHVLILRQSMLGGNNEGGLVSASSLSIAHSQAQSMDHSQGLPVQAPPPAPAPAPAEPPKDCAPNCTKATLVSTLWLLFIGIAAEVVAASLYLLACHGLDGFERGMRNYRDILTGGEVQWCDAGSIDCGLSVPW